MNKTLHIVDLDNLHIYMISQILGCAEDEALRLYNQYFESEEEHERDARSIE